MTQHRTLDISPANINSGDAVQLSLQSNTAQSVGNESIDISWKEAGLKSNPVIVFGLSTLEDKIKLLRRDAMVSIAWIQPKHLHAQYWAFDLLVECSFLGYNITQEPHFRPLTESKFPRVFQLDPGGICWVRQGYFGVVVHLHDKDIDITVVSKNEASSCEATWAIDDQLYLMQSGFKAKARVKFVAVLFRLEENNHRQDLMHPPD
ncbi:hypothetical protein B0T10DRAFT_501159 [Thelonectria olida]|uniref:Uncharacterized protein n=1 Tax=Thelonectria olida TaxID=1576542 RepID=A0A9P8VQ05_9HYPO|nr:hypothetical protein B0T10DRAFT_501159 [Thelonectria olida]